MWAAASIPLARPLTTVIPAEDSVSAMRFGEQHPLEARLPRPHHGEGLASEAGEAPSCTAREARRVCSRKERRVSGVLYGEDGAAHPGKARQVLVDRPKSAKGAYRPVIGGIFSPFLPLEQGRDAFVLLRQPFLAHVTDLV